MTPSNPPHSAAAVPAFYDAVSRFYDDMTGRGHRSPGFKAAIEEIVRTNRIATALDAGCGTGSLSIPLAQLGVDVSAVDLSAGMIAALKKHAETLGVSLHAYSLDLRHLPVIGTGQMDAVFCLGNTLAHLEGSAAQSEALKEFSRVLRPGGLLIVQVLNFEPYQEGDQLPHFVSESARSLFDRRYVRTDTGFQIRIEEQDKNSGVRGSFSLDIYPVRQGMLSHILAGAGFAETVFYGDLGRSEWKAGESRDLVAFATKSILR
jgi:glycine/sarcosine N-methyltransferase